MQKYRLESCGEDYLRSYLENEIGLAALVLECLSEGGTVSTFLPDVAYLSRANQPVLGRLFSPNQAKEAVSELDGYLRQAVSGSSGSSVVVIQDVWALPSDVEHRSKQEELLLNAGFGVCRAIELDKVAAGELASMMTDTISAHYVGAVLRRLPVLNQDRLADAELGSLIDAAFVPAYDGESFLIWERSNKLASLTKASSTITSR